MGTDKGFTAGITWHGAWYRAYVYRASRKSGRQTYGKNKQGGLIHEFWSESMCDSFLSEKLRH